ncbi:Lipase_3 domain-containing protein [Psidium guajava]|nr:Lipase_3 domain-containing protein [Psidium guajava]
MAEICSSGCLLFLVRFPWGGECDRHYFAERGDGGGITSSLSNLFEIFLCPCIHGKWAHQDLQLHRLSDRGPVKVSFPFQN